MGIAGHPEHFFQSPQAANPDEGDEKIQDGRRDVESRVFRRACGYGLGAGHEFHGAENRDQR